MITLENVGKTFTTKDRVVEAVKNVSLQVEKGEIYGIIGFSGAGKSTLVRCINLLERPSEGKVFLGEIELTTLTDAQLRKERSKISMIFQHFNLFSQRTALRNVCYPLEIAGFSKKEAIQRAEKLLQLVGLEECKNSYPSQLSGGQKQRVAIARALATNPEVLLCDEATSALDPNTTISILDLLKRINKEMGLTIVIITHEMKVVEHICDKVAVLENGTLVETGSVQEVFMAPKSQVAKKLIMPQGETASSFENHKILRIVFDGQSSFEPVISNMILECRATVNILGANTENIGGKAFGQMILQLPEDEMVIGRIKNYLDTVGIHYEEGGA